MATRHLGRKGTTRTEPRTAANWVARTRDPQLASLAPVILCAVIERKAAMPHLRALRNPTLEAFAHAQSVVTRLRKAAGKDMDGLESGVAGSFHGVSFWAFFASGLTTAYAEVAVRDPSTSDQRHCWLTRDGKFLIYLKSNIEELCFEQLMLENFPKVESASPAFVALTWEHEGADRLHPAFVHLVEGRPVWEISARELAAPKVQPIRQSVPSPALNLRTKRKRQQSTDAPNG